MSKETTRMRFSRSTGSPETPPSGDKRILVAVYRALEPLYGAEESWGVERSIHEMHAEGDLGDFLKAALKCEEILMRRERDLDRLIGLAPAEDYGEWLAKAEEDGLE